MPLDEAPIWWVATRQGDTERMTREQAERVAQALQDAGEPDVFVNHSNPFEEG